MNAHMMPRRRWFLLGLAAVALLLTAGATALEELGYTLGRWTVDAGGGLSSGSGYEMAGTIGQPGPGALSGGGYTLAGGFWPEEGAAARACYLPLIVR